MGFLGPRTIGNESLVKNKFLEKNKISKIFQHFFKNCIFDSKNPFFDQENHFFDHKIIFLDPISLIFIQFHHILTHFHHIWSYFDRFFDFHDFCRANYSQGHLFGNQVTLGLLLPTDYYCYRRKHCGFETFL